MKTATVQKRCTVALTSTLCSVFIRKNHKRIMLVAGSSTGTAKLRDAVWQTVSFHLTLTGMFSIKMNQIIFILSSFFRKLIFHPGCHCILIFTLVIHSPPDAAPVVCASGNFCYAPVAAAFRIIRLNHIALEPTGARIAKYISLTKRRIPCRSPDIQTSIDLCFF